MVGEQIEQKELGTYIKLKSELIVTLLLVLMMMKGLNVIG